jgi:hypothetical protein
MTPLPLLMLEAGSNTKFLTIFANPTLWTFLGSLKELGGASLAIWLPTIKSRESTRFPCVHVVCDILLKALNEGYNFASDLIVIKILHAKLWGPKVVGVPIVGILGLPLGSLGTKCHLDVAPVQRCRKYYKGEGGGFPRVWAVMSLVSPSCPWLVLAPKVLQLCTNHLVLVLCRSVWIIETFQFFLVPSWSSNTPLYPSKVLWTRERAPTPCSSVVFCLGFTFESLKELGARHY